MTKKVILTLLLGVFGIYCLGNLLTADSSTTQPNDKQDVTLASPSISYWIGVRVVPVPDILLSHFGVQEKGGGLTVVEEVVPDGPAEKGGLKRGDIIKKFGDREIHSFADLVEQVTVAGEIEQKVSIIRDGSATELTITPAERPAGQLAVRGLPHGLPHGFPQGFHAMPMIPPQPGMKLGNDVWVGRDPQKMMKEMEKHFRQMQGGTDGEESLILPESGAMDAAEGVIGQNLSVSSVTENGKTKIHVKQTVKSGGSTEEKTWEAETIDELPDEIRGEVKALLGH
jgi:membrane-associated protease RseP (regulator of RpoE activity)